MCPNSIVSQRGSFLVIAVFVLIVFAGLVLSLTRILSASTDAVVYEVYGLRAQMAAQAGLEAQLNAVFPRENGGRVSLCAPTGTVTPAIPGLQGCAYTSVCNAQVYNPEGGASFTYYRFSATGFCNAGEVSVSRTLSVDARN